MMYGLEHQAKTFRFSLLGTVGPLEDYQSLVKIQKSVLLPETDWYLFYNITSGETENEWWINMPKIADSKSKWTLNVWMC